MDATSVKSVVPALFVKLIISVWEVPIVMLFGANSSIVELGAALAIKGNNNDIERKEISKIMNLIPLFNLDDL